MKNKSGFIYIWYDKKLSRYYIGCHWGFEDDGYVCSSSWMKKAYKNRPHDFKRRILKRNIQVRQEMFLEEERWLNMIKPSEIKPINNHPRYYNLNIKNNEVWHKYEENLKTVGQKISAAKKGKSAGPCSPEKAAAISEAKKKKFAKRGGITEEHKLALQKAARERNCKHTDEWKQQNSERMKEQWNNGTRKRAEPKQSMTLEEQAQLSSDRLKKNWSNPEWKAKQLERLSDGAKSRPPRSEESKQKTRDAFARRRG